MWRKRSQHRKTAKVSYPSEGHAVGPVLMQSQEQPPNLLSYLIYLSAETMAINTFILHLKIATKGLCFIVKATRTINSKSFESKSHILKHSC